MNRQLKQILRAVAQEKHTSMAELEKAIAQHGREPVTTKEEVLRCWDSYAGPEIKRLRIRVAADEQIKNDQQAMIEEAEQELREFREISEKSNENQEKLIETQARMILRLNGKQNSQQS